MQKIPDPLIETPSSPPGETIPIAERWAAAFLLFCAFCLRCFYIFRYRYDSDEPQHLHTTWGWTQGMLQYRDFFDNHTPLFHMLFSPLVALFDERADILTYMRFTMVPLWFVALWAVWRIGSHVFSRRAGLWAVVFISVLPWWAFCALEYRTDNLWAPLWFCSLAVLLTGRLTSWRAFAGGLLLGTCACTSMKTSLLLAVSAMAALASTQVCARRFDRESLARLLKLALPILAGLIIVPAIICAFFASQGCWERFYYCVIKHNTMIDADSSAHPWYQRLSFPIALPLLLFVAYRISRGWTDAALARRRIFLFLFAGLYYASLDSFWALLTRQDYLPFYPVAAIVAAPFLLWLIEKATEHKNATANISSRRIWILSAVAVAEIITMLGGRPPWINATRDKQERIREAIQLTKPGEYVMDFKGECVFRRRAFYYVLEPLTVKRIQRGSLEETIPADMVDKKVCLVTNRERDLRYPKKTTAFIAENYLNIGQVRVAGKFIASKETVVGQPISFHVVIPTRYIIWANGEPVHGTLDGLPYDDVRELSVGAHEFKPDAPNRRLAIFWERASKAGYSPIPDQSW